MPTATGLLKLTYHSISRIKEHLRTTNDRNFSREFEEYISFDILSDVLDKHGFLRILEHVKPNYVIVVSIDRIRHIHRAHGYEAAGSVIKYLGRSVKHLTQYPDFVGRTRDGTFCICLMKSDANSESVAANIQAEMKFAPFSFEITLSMGIAQRRENECGLDTRVRANLFVTEAKKRMRRGFILSDLSIVQASQHYISHTVQ